MQPPSWQIDGHMARMRVGMLAATVDLDKPADGLGRLLLAHRLIFPVSVMGVVLAERCDRAVPADTYVREDDLVATYPATDECPLRTQVYWRVLTEPPGAPEATGIDLQVSVQTDQLASTSAGRSHTLLPAKEVVHLACGRRGAAAFEPLRLRSGERVELRPDSSSGCYLYRLPHGDVSYAEMVHPDDFHCDHLTAMYNPDYCVELEHDLFGTSLEKGVILRTRVRGLILDREGDEAVVRSAYAEFRNAPPPLTA